MKLLGVCPLYRPHKVNRIETVKVNLEAETACEASLTITTSTVLEIWPN
jgi:hypothetical protein